MNAYVPVLESNLDISISCLFQKFSMIYPRGVAGDFVSIPHQNSACLCGNKVAVRKLKCLQEEECKKIFLSFLN